MRRWSATPARSRSTSSQRLRGKWVPRAKPSSKALFSPFAHKRESQITRRLRTNSGTTPRPRRNSQVPNHSAHRALANAELPANRRVNELIGPKLARPLTKTKTPTRRSEPSHRARRSRTPSHSANREPTARETPSRSAARRAPTRLQTPSFPSPHPRPSRNEKTPHKQATQPARARRNNAVTFS